MKIKIDTSDEETRRIWLAAKRAASDVATWPVWKGGQGMPRWWDNLGKGFRDAGILTKAATK